MATSRILLKTFRHCERRPSCSWLPWGSTRGSNCLSRSYSVSHAGNNIMQSSYPDVAIPSDQSLAQYMMESFAKYGNKVAMVNAATGQEWTYDKLRVSIRRVASAFSKAGVGQGDVVTLFSPNCPEFLITLLAANACGAICSPLNPLYSSRELNHATEMAEAKIVVTVPELLPIVNETCKTVSSIKGVITFGEANGCRPFSDLLEDDGSHFSESSYISPKTDICSLPFSSGTTGLPKAVMLSHYNIIANIQQLSSENFYQLTPEDVFLGVLPFFHIYGMTVVLLVGLYNGVKVVSLPKFDPQTFLTAAQDHKATYMHNVPPIVLFLARHPLVGQFEFSALRNMIVAAAPLSEDIGREATDKMRRPGIDVRQAYGMTESSPVTHGTPPNAGNVASVGQVINTSQSKVIDVASGEALGRNQEGEICSRGPQIMLGYLKNPKATSETVDQDGWLHTGDLGYYDEKGFFYVTDRLKELIKCKGFQVAPAELESVLLRHPAVADAAVIGIPDERSGEVPRAFVKVKEGSRTTEEDIMTFVKGEVAGYKQLAGGVQFRSDIPKSAAGKILRRILRDEYKEQKKTE